MDTRIDWQWRGTEYGWRCGVRKALGVWTVFAYSASGVVLIALPFPSWRKAIWFACTGAYLCGPYDE